MSGSVPRASWWCRLMHATRWRFVVAEDDDGVIIDCPVHGLRHARAPR